jgi:hypothetical protein
MNDDELFEAELKQLKPAQPPAQFLERLTTAPIHAPERTRVSQTGWKRFLNLWFSRPAGRWFAPASALAIGFGSLLLLRLTSLPTKPPSPQPFHATQTPLKANNVEIDHRLLASFDAIARLPDGAPVRLRCRQWTDQVRVVDSSGDVVIEQTKPRLEIIPVKFETY